jgi:hypothetical protein
MVGTRIRTKAQLKASKSDQKLFKHLSKKISFVLSILPEVKSLETMPSSKKLPIARLGSSASQFLRRNYESCILEATFATEYALLFALNEKMEKKEKEEIENRNTGLGLMKAIALARGTLISETLANDLLLLNNLRNMSAHPSNWITLLNQLKEMAKDEKLTIKWVTKSTNQSPVQMAQSLKEDFNVEKANQTVEDMHSFGESYWSDLPDLKWATNKATLQFQMDYVKDYFKPMARDLIIDKQIIPLINRPQSATHRLVNKYNFPQQLAIKSLEIAHNTLIELKIME